MKTSLVTGLHGPVGIVVSGSDLFVANDAGGTIGEYTTSGSTVNASLISGLSGPIALALVPEPSTALLLSAGILGLAVRRRSL